MRQSNGYIIFFTAVLTVCVGGILAGASIVLGPAQRKSIELDTKSQILGAVRHRVEINTKADILELYNDRISSLVVNAQGDQVTTDAKGKPIEAEKVDVLKNFKLKPADRLYPIYRLMDRDNPKQVDAYIVPVYGNGLWDKIWGYVALDPELKQIVGTTFDHKSETPGLGQRIATEEIQDRFIGKKIYDESGEFISVEMTKGEHGGGQASIDYYKDAPHKVDGMSGATLTGRGLNQMLKAYLQAYQPYFNKVTQEKE